MLVYDLAYDFHSKRLAVSYSDKSIKIYTKSKNEWKVTTEIKMDGCARKVAWAPPQFGQILAAATLDDKLVRIYEETYDSDSKSPSNGHTFKECQRISLDSEPTGLAFRPGSEPSLRLTLAIPCKDGRVRVVRASDAMSLSDWKLSSVFEAGEKAPVSSLAWNPDPFEIPALIIGCGKQLSVWQHYESQQRWVKVADVATHKSDINSVSWAPSMGRSFHLIATAGESVRIYKLKPNQDSSGGGGRFDIGVPTELKRHKGAVWDVSWNITGSILASSGADGKVYLWKSDFQGWSCLLKATSEEEKGV